MIHKVQISNGKAFYSNSYVQTPKYKIEKEYKRSLTYGIKHVLDPVASVHIFVRKLFCQKTLSTKDFEFNTANTSLLYYDNKFFALMEGCRPTEINLSNLQTVLLFLINLDW